MASVDRRQIDERFVFAYNRPAIGKIVGAITKSFSLPGKADRADFIQEAWLAVLDVCETLDPRESRRHFENTLWKAIPRRLLDEVVDPFSTMKRDPSVEVPYLEGEEVELDLGEEERTLLSVAYTTSTENCVAVKELLEKLSEEVRSSGNPKLISTFMSMVRDEARDASMVSTRTYAKYRRRVLEIAHRLADEEMRDQRVVA